MDSGFFRALQSNFINTLITFTVIGIIYGIARYLCTVIDPDQKENNISTLNILTTIISSVLLVIFIINITVLGISNRTNRSDINKQPVYEQMNSH
jgi:hypothetical protein